MIARPGVGVVARLGALGRTVALEASLGLPSGADGVPVGAGGDGAGDARSRVAVDPEAALDLGGVVLVEIHPLAVLGARLLVGGGAEFLRRGLPDARYPATKRFAPFVRVEPAGASQRAEVQLVVGDDPGGAGPEIQFQARELVSTRLGEVQLVVGDDPGGAGPEVQFQARGLVRTRRGLGISTRCCGRILGDCGARLGFGRRSTFTHRRPGQGTFHADPPALMPAPCKADFRYSA